MSTTFYANTWSIIDGSNVVKIITNIDSSLLDKIYSYDEQTEQYSTIIFKNANGDYVSNVSDTIDSHAKHWVRFNTDTTIDFDLIVTVSENVNDLGLINELAKASLDDSNVAEVDDYEVVFYNGKWFKMDDDGTWSRTTKPEGLPKWKNAEKREMQGKPEEEEPEEGELPSDIPSAILEWIGMDEEMDPIPALIGIFPATRPFKTLLVGLWDDINKFIDFIDAALAQLGGMAVADSKEAYPEFFDESGFMKSDALPHLLSNLIPGIDEGDGPVGRLIQHTLATIMEAFFAVPEKAFDMISRVHMTLGSTELRAFGINMATIFFEVMKCIQEPLNIIPVLGIDLTALLSGEMPSIDIDDITDTGIPDPLTPSIAGMFGVFWKFITETLVERFVEAIPKYIQGTFNTFQIARFLMAFLTDFNAAVPTLAMTVLIQSSMKAVLGPLAGVGPIIQALTQTASDSAVDEDGNKPRMDPKKVRDTSDKTTAATQAKNEDDGGEGIDISEVFDTEVILKGLLDLILIVLEVMMLPMKIIPSVLTNLFNQFIRMGLSMILGSDVPQEYVDTTIKIAEYFFIYMTGGPFALLLPHLYAFVESMINFDLSNFISLFSANKDDTVLIIENQYRPMSYETDGLIPQPINDRPYIPWVDHFRKRPLTYFNISCKARFLEFDPLGSGEGSMLQFGKIPDSKWCLIAPDPGRQQFYFYDMVSYYFLRTEGNNLVVTYDKPSLFEIRKRSIHTIWQTHIKTLDVDQELVGYRDTDPYNDGSTTTKEDLFFRAYSEVGRTWSSLPSKKFSVKNYLRADNFMRNFEVKAFNPAGNSVRYAMRSTTTVEWKYLSLLDMTVKFPKSTYAGVVSRSAVRKLIKIESTKGSSIYIDEIGMEDKIFQSKGYALTSNAKWLNFEEDQNGILGMDTVTEKPTDAFMFIPMAFEQAGETRYKIGWYFDNKFGLWRNGEYIDHDSNIIGDVIVFEDFTNRGLDAIQDATDTRYVFSLKIFQGCPAGTVNLKDLTGIDTTTITYSDQDEGMEYEDEEFVPEKPSDDDKVEYEGKGKYVKANIVDVESGKIISMKLDGTVCMDDLSPDKIINQTLNVAYTTIDVGYLQMSDGKMSKVEAGQYEDPTAIVKSVKFNASKCNPFKLFPARVDPYDPISTTYYRYKPFIMRNRSAFRFLTNDTLKMEKLDYKRIQQYMFYALKHVDRIDSRVCVRLGANYLTQDMEIVPAEDVLYSDFTSFVEFRMIGYPRIQLHRPKQAGSFEGANNELRLHYSFKANYMQGGSFCYREVSSSSSGKLDKTVMFENIDAKDQMLEVNAVMPDTDSFVLVYREGINQFYLTTQTSYTAIDIKARINSIGQPVYVYQVILNNNGAEYNLNTKLEVFMHALNYELEPGVKISKMAIHDNLLPTETLLIDFSMLGLVYNQMTKDSNGNVYATKLQWTHHDLENFDHLDRVSTVQSKQQTMSVSNDYIMSFHGMFIHDFETYYVHNNKHPYDIVTLNSPDGQYRCHAFGVDENNTITFSEYEPLDSYKYQLYHYRDKVIKEVDYLFVTVLTIYCIIIYFGDADDGLTLETGSLYANAVQYLHSNFLGIIFVILKDFIDAPFHTLVETVTDLEFSGTESAGDVLQDWLGEVIGWPFFTGSHISLPSEAAASIQNWDQHIGKVMVSSGQYATMAGTTLDQGIDAIQMSNAWPRLELSSSKNQPAVYGVLAGMRKRHDQDFLVVNGCGEGAILVTNINGNITNGDYVTTSDCPGLCMKQDDDVLHSYTVAKITTSCDFLLPAEQTKGQTYRCYEIQHDGQTVRVALLGCTYKCS